MNILYVTPYVPSRIRTRPYNLIRTLIRLGHRVTLLTAAGPSPEEQEQADQLRGWGMEVEVFPVPVLRSLGNCLRALPTREPLQAVYAFHPAMERELGELVNERTFDLVHIEHLRASRLVSAVRNTPVVYDSVDSISLLFEQATKEGAQLRSRLMTTVDLARTRRYEAWLLTQYNQVVVTSRRDKDALEGLARQYLSTQTRTAPITVVTNGVDLEYFQPPETRLCRFAKGKNLVSPPTVVFTGKMSYHANIAAALYFAREVLPRIWTQDPGVRFQIVGKDPPEAVQKLATDGRIQVTGTVDDLRPYLAQATAAVCPALYAVGVQNKVLEAMAMGAPVVSTSAGCAGLGAEQGREILAADGAEHLATAILRVLSDPDLAGRLSVAGRQYVEGQHSWESNTRHLVEVYEQARSVFTILSEEREGKRTWG
jgi:sugar transferase (PEP-CTERM/EpsH1 system associated)